jgi:hypothetical protein
VITTGSPRCVACNQQVDSEDVEFSQDQQQHPGILGDVHPACYRSASDSQPDLPWEDPISGEVDYEAMAEDLGVSFGDGEEEDGF